MKIAAICSMTVVLGVVLFGCMVQVSKTAPEGVTANEDMARAVAQALVDGDFAGARSNFDETMEAAPPAAGLESAWNGQTGALGAFQELGETRVEYVADNPCVFVPVVFAQGEIVVQVTQDAAGEQVTGLYLRPAGFSFL